jgi:hypothetical protein
MRQRRRWDPGTGEARSGRAMFFLFFLLPLFEMESCYVVHSGFKLLSLSDPPASGS